MKLASMLRAEGLANAFDLSPKQVAFEALRAAEDGREDFFMSAVATAIGFGGDKKAWKAIEP